MQASRAPAPAPCEQGHAQRTWHMHMACAHAMHLRTHSAHPPPFPPPLLPRPFPSHTMMQTAPHLDEDGPSGCSCGNGSERAGIYTIYTPAAPGPCAASPLPCSPLPRQGQAGALHSANLTPAGQLPPKPLHLPPLSRYAHPSTPSRLASPLSPRPRQEQAGTFDNTHCTVKCM